MTIASTASEVSYAGDGSSVAFPIPFPFDTSADLKVTLTVGGGTPATITSGFAVTGGGGSTGTLTMLSAIAVGTTLTILDDPAITQPAHYTNNDSFPAATHEGALDRTVRICKRLSQRLSRMIRTADGDPISGDGLVLGSVDTRKGKYLFFNAVTGAIEYAVALATTALSRSIIAQLLNPQTAEESAASITPTNYWYRPGSVLRYGAVGGDTSPATNNSAFSSALLTGLPIYVPAGTYQLSANMAAALAGVTLFGDGIGKSIVHFKNSGANLGGFVVSASKITFRDLTIQVDVNSQTSCAGVTLTGTVDFPTFERVEFIGITTKLNNWGIFVSTCTLTGLGVHRCRFEQLDLGVFKPNGDSSVQRGTVFTDCYAKNCTDAFEINNTTGAWSDVTIANCVFDTISQFPVGIAGIDRFTVSGCHFTNCQIEAVHIEAASTDGKVIGCDFKSCNLTNGVVGAVSIITGSHDILVADNNFNLFQNATGTPFGVTAQPGSGAAPYNITVKGNTFKCLTKLGATDIYAVQFSQGVGGVISANTFSNPTVASKIANFVDLSDSLVHMADNVFQNPKGLINVNTNAYGDVYDSHIEGDLTNFSFLSGNGSATCSIVFRSFSLKRAFTSDAVPTAQTMFPAGSIFSGLAAVSFRMNGTTTSWTTIVQLDWDGTTLTVGTPKKNNSGTSSAPTNVQWTQAAGSIKAASTSTGATYAGAVLITFIGAYYP